MSRDSPYPELKKRHTMAHTGRPWRDHKPPPAAPVWGVIQGVGNYYALCAAIELGVFDALDRLGPAPIDVLAGQLGASAVHLEHLCDALVALGFLDQLDDVYELTETAERYLCTGGAASMAGLVAVAPGPLANWRTLAGTVRHGSVAEPIEDDPAAFYGPLVSATFPTQLRAATRLGLRVGWPRRPGLRVLDLGAGRAPWAIAVLEQSAGSTAVVNDLPEVLPLAESMLAERGLSERVTLVPGDFHALELDAQGFDVVVLGHICRTEGDERSQALVRRAYDALRPGGQIVIADYFADDERKMNRFGVLMGLTMLANTERGGRLTTTQVSGWLRDAGFARIRLVEPIGFNHVYVADKRTPVGG